jgi:DNA repair photolyase
MSIHPFEASIVLPRVETVTSAEPLLRPCRLAVGADVKCIDLITPDGPNPDAALFPLLPVVLQHGPVRLLGGSAARLQRELSGRDTPRAVHLCPSADPFLPSSTLQDEVAAVTDVLARCGLQIWLVTRGYLRYDARRTLLRHRDRVKVRFGLSTLDRSLQRALEPCAAPPALRLRQIARLRSAGVAVQVALEPLVPELTDGRENLYAVLACLADLGIRHVSAGYLNLPVDFEEPFREYLQPFGWDGPVLGAYANGFIRREGTTLVRYLAKGRRQQGYARLMALAAEFGIAVKVSAASNPDFTRAAPKATPVQPSLKFSFPPTESLS